MFILDLLRADMFESYDEGKASHQEPIIAISAWQNYGLDECYITFFENDLEECKINHKVENTGL